MSHWSRRCAAAGDIRGWSRISRSLPSGAHSRGPLAHAGYGLMSFSTTQNIDYRF
jgi:hypothetical protein